MWSFFGIVLYSISDLSYPTCIVTHHLFSLYAIFSLSNIASCQKKNCGSIYTRLFYQGSVVDALYGTLCVDEAPATAGASSVGATTFGATSVGAAAFGASSTVRVPPATVDANGDAAGSSI